jgi:hypothetical protein
MRALAVLALSLSLAASAAMAQPNPVPAPPPEPFMAMAPVLASPRCMNCHTVSGFPRQGDDRHPHRLNVQRGPDDRGAPGLACTTCHGRANNAASRVPGAPDEDWRLAPLKMAWENLSPAELCRHLRDPGINGNRRGEQMLAHMKSTFVAWAWAPGVSANGRPRVPPPLAYDEFLKATEAWILAGQPCPGDARM